MYVYLQLRHPRIGRLLGYFEPCSRDRYCGRKDGAILEMGYLSPRLRVKPPYWSMLKFLAPPTKFGTQLRIHRRIHGHGLLAWRLPRVHLERGTNGHVFLRRAQTHTRRCLVQWAQRGSGCVEIQLHGRGSGGQSNLQTLNRLKTVWLPLEMVSDSHDSKKC